MKKKFKKKIKVNFFNAFMLLTAAIGAGVLLYDLIVWAIIPVFNGEFICMTYFGMFVDLFALGLVELGIQCLEEY